MRSLIVPWVVGAALAVAGCIPSLQPLYTDKTTVFDPALVGFWVQDNGHSTWEFVRNESNTYGLTYTDKEGKPGHFAGSFAPPAVGDYELRATAQEYKGDGPDSPAASFRAEEPQREMGDVRADRPLLKDLAARTRGLSAEIFELAKLADPQLIPPASERVVTQGRPVPLWDTWTTVIAFLLLLCAEWIVRKRYRMV